MANVGGVRKFAGTLSDDVMDGPCPLLGITVTLYFPPGITPAVAEAVAGKLLSQSWTQKALSLKYHAWTGSTANTVPSGRQLNALDVIRRIGGGLKIV